MLVLAGRAPAMRWGQGSLQELDHIPFVAPLTKFATTPDTTAEIPELVDEALVRAMTPHSGPTFLDFPWTSSSRTPRSPRAPRSCRTPRPARCPTSPRPARLLREAERPVVMAGTNLYWGHGERALVELAEELGVPVFLNGLARGCVPADHELFFSRARSEGLKGADLALVVGVPMDFRLAFGAAFGDETQLVVIDRAEAIRPHPRPVAADLVGSIGGILDALRSAASGGASTRAWVEHLRAAETERRAAEREQLDDERAPLHPMRLYRELGQMLDRDAIVIGDGGDFVSYAGRVVDSYAPGCWLDPGPFGCLGSGPGYALAAKLAHPGRQVVLLLGDGAFGFSGMEFDTLARHGVDVVGVMGNNGIWALEKHPMEFLYGYSVAASCARRRATTRWSRRSAATASSCARRTSCAPRSSAPSARAGRARQRPDGPRGRLPARSNLA
jgi:acetolactate synthase-1/2/3 large subunit